MGLEGMDRAQISRSWSAGRLRPDHSRDLLWQPSGSKILGGTSEEARHKKELQELKRAYQELQKQQAAANGKAEDYRLKLKECRGTLAVKEKHLETAQRLLDRLGVEKQEMQASATSEKAYTRKLECKVASLKDMPELQEKYSRLKKQARELQQRLMHTEAELAASEDISAERLREVDTLRRALDLRAWEMSAEEGANVQARMLYALAKSREETTQLALQLSECRDEQRRVQQLLQASTSENRALQKLKDAAELHAAQLDSQLQEALAVQRQVQQAAAAGDKDAARLRGQLQEAHAESLRLQAELHQEQQQRCRLDDLLARAQQDAERVVQAARAEAALQVERAQVQASESRRCANASEAELRYQCTRLTQQLAELQAISERERRTAESDSKTKAGRLVMLEAQLQGSQQHEEQLLQQVAQLRSQLEAQAQELARLAGESSGAVELSAHATSLQQQLQQLQARHAALQDQHQEEVLALQQELELVLEDNQTLQLQLAEAQARCSEAVLDKDGLETKVAQLQGMADALGRSKALLQEAMMEQIDQAKSKLSSVEGLALQKAAKQQQQQRRQQAVRSIAAGAGGSASRDAPPAARRPTARELSPPGRQHNMHKAAKPLDQIKRQPSPHGSSARLPRPAGLIKAACTAPAGRWQAKAMQLDLSSDDDENDDDHLPCSRPRVMMFNSAAGTASAVDRTAPAPRPVLLQRHSSGSSRSGDAGAGAGRLGSREDALAKKRAAKRALQDVRAGAAAAAAARDRVQQQQAQQQQPVPPAVARESSFTRKQLAVFTAAPAGRRASEQGYSTPAELSTDGSQQQLLLQAGTYLTYAAGPAAVPASPSAQQLHPQHRPELHVGSPSVMGDDQVFQPSALSSSGSVHPGTQPALGPACTDTHCNSSSAAAGQSAVAVQGQLQRSSTSDTGSSPGMRKLTHVQMQLARKRLELAAALGSSGSTSPKVERSPSRQQQQQLQHAEPVQRSALSSPLQAPGPLAVVATAEAAPVRSSWSAGMAVQEAQQYDHMQHGAAGWATPAASRAGAAAATMPGALMTPPSTVRSKQTLSRTQASEAGGASRFAAAAAAAGTAAASAGEELLDELIHQLQQEQPTLEQLAGLDL